MKHLLTFAIAWTAATYYVTGEIPSWLKESALFVASKAKEMDTKLKDGRW